MQEQNTAIVQVLMGACWKDTVQYIEKGLDALITGLDSWFTYMGLDV